MGHRFSARAVSSLGRQRSEFTDVFTADIV